MVSPNMLSASKSKDPTRLRQEIDDWMAQYDERQEEKKRLAKETQVDDDGFTKVVSGITRTADGLTIRGARRPSLKTGAFGESSAAALEQPSLTGKKKKKSKEMPDFYRFQQREKRREELIDFRKRNSKDQETVKQMKKAGASGISRMARKLCALPGRPSASKRRLLENRELQKESEASTRRIAFARDRSLVNQSVLRFCPGPFATPSVLTSRTRPQDVGNSATLENVGPGERIQSPHVKLSQLSCQPMLPGLCNFVQRSSVQVLTDSR